MAAPRSSLRILLPLLLALGAAAPLAETLAEAATPIGEDPALEAMERLGLDIYRADRAAWLTTDELKAKRLLRKLPGKPGGWVTTPPDDANPTWRVAYVVRVDGEPLSFADGVVDFSSAKPSVTVARNEPLRPLEPLEAALLAARDDAVGREWMVCGRDPYNSVVLADGDGIRVYLMPPQRSAREFPMGGFHRFRYDADGKLLEQYAHTRSCIVQSEAGLPRGSTLEGLVITHITSPTPNEMHVFMNLSYRKPVYVGTEDRRFWKVDEGDIAFLTSLDDPEQP